MKFTTQGAFESTLISSVFVLLWSSGFIGARLGLPYADPLMFMAWRFGLAALLMLPVSLLMNAHGRERGHG